MNKTIAGKSLQEQIDKIHKKNISDFKKIEEKLKKTGIVNFVSKKYIN